MDNIKNETLVFLNNILIPSLNCELNLSILWYNIHIEVENMKLYIPDSIGEIINRLNEHGYEGYIVGGSVRDLVLGKAPKDYDITTSAKPDDIERVFQDKKTFDVGRHFGTIVVVTEEGNVEVTTYRTDGEYEDGRRPKEVYYTPDIIEDLSRRDFTINAMAYNENGLLDPFSGMKDLRKKYIRTVGDPYKRFEEDYLRILRAVRFATQLGFQIDNKTKDACKKYAININRISYERIREEVFKILLSKTPSVGFRLMDELSILEVIFPELARTINFDQRNPHHNRNLFDHTLCVVDNTPPVLTVRMSALLHDIGKPTAFSIDEEGIGHYYNHDKIGAERSRNMLNRLKCSKEFIDEVTLFVREHMFYEGMKEKGIKRMLRRVGQDKIFDLMELKKADMKCKNNKDESLIDDQIDEVRKILDSSEPFKKEHLAVDGHDIIRLGYKRGVLIGEILDYLLERVVNNPKINNKEDLIEITKEKYKI